MTTGPIAYRWRRNQLQSISHAQHVELDDLLGIERQKSALLQNSRQFVAARPANHALLTGARGTGKSSLVKSMLTLLAPVGLRLVEVPVQSLIDLPDIIEPLRGRKERFILYVDDFSVSGNDPALAALKGTLDGGVEESPDNVVIYATSNRRHLLPQSRSDNEEYRWSAEGDLQPGESAEEKISLSERFGLWLSFPPFSQEQYLDTVQLHLRRLGVRDWNDDIRGEALRWALRRASRSGRVAQQFARDLVGRRQ